MMLRAEPSVLELTAVALAARRTILWIAVGLTGVVAVLTLLRDRTYSSSASFVPATRNGELSRLAGVAAQFGVAVGGQEPGTSPAYFSDLLVSDGVLRAVASRDYEFDLDGTNTVAPLASFFEITTDDSAMARERSVDALRRAITASVGGGSGVVRLRVSTRDRHVSLQLAQTLLMITDSVNVGARQSQARREREFVAERLTETQEELRAVERRLESFLSANREYRRSPTLVLTYERLQREVGLRQQIVTTLAQSYEQARIDEVRNIPLLSVIDPPVLAARPDRRGLVIRSMAAMLLGLVGGVSVAIITALWRRRREDEPQVARQLGAEWAETLADVRRPWRLVGAGSVRDPGHSESGT